MASSSGQHGSDPSARRSEWSDDDPLLALLPEDTRATYNPNLTAPPTAMLSSDSEGATGETLDFGGGGAGEDVGPAGRGPIARRLLGSGGFGEVWEAIDPALGRVVAIKRIRPDLLARVADSPRELSHHRGLFFREAITTARLEHPNIVPVHQFLFDSAGNPILAMKRVQGSVWETLLDADRRLLSPHDFYAKHIPVLIAVAQALAFAHDRGVVHRDLKPGQVMVGEYGEVLLMDWGLAMVHDEVRFGVDDSLTLGLPVPYTRSTASNPSGTTAYMAPEQTQKQTDGLGPHTDIFLLGGTLYYLLAGVPPHAAGERRAAFMQAIVCDVPHPAVRAGSDRFLPEELVSLAMRCLSADPSARPATARVVADELRDYLTGASRRRESQRLCEAAAEDFATASDYRAFGELVARLGNARALWPENPEVGPLRDRVVTAYAEAALRNGDLTLAAVQAERIQDSSAREALEARISAAQASARRSHHQRRVSLAAVVALLVLIAVGSGVFSARQRAARLAIAAANDELKRQRDEGNELLTFVLRDLGHRLEPVGQLDLLHDVAMRAREYYDRLPAAGEGPDARRNRAMAFRQIGDVLMAQNRLGEAEESFLSGIELLSRTDDVPAEQIGGTVAERIGLELRLAALNSQRGDWREFESGLSSILGELRSWTADDESAGGPRALLARALLLKSNSYPSRGTLEESLEAAREASAVAAALVQTDRPPLEHLRLAADASRAVSSALRRTGDVKGALEILESERDYWRKSLEHLPNDARAIEGLVETMAAIGQARYDQGEFPAALEIYRECVVIRQGLVRRDPANRRWRIELAGAHNSVAFIHHWRGEFDAALESYQAAEAIYADSIDREPRNLSVRQDRATTLNNIGSVLSFLGRVRESVPYFEQMRHELETILERDPNNAAALRLLATNHGKLGINHESFGRYEEAVGEYLRQIAIFQRIAADDVTDTQIREALTSAHVHLGMVRDAMGDHAGSLEAFGEARRQHDQVAAAMPEASPAAYRDAMNLLGRTLNSLHELGKDEEVRTTVEELRRIHGELAKIAPADLGDRMRLYSIELRAISWGVDHPVGSEASIAQAEQLVEVVRESVAEHSNHRAIRRILAQAIRLHARTLVEAGMSERASELEMEALEIFRDLFLSEDPGSRVDLTRSLVAAGRLDEAREQVAELVAMGYHAERAEKLLVPQED